MLVNVLASGSKGNVTLVKTSKYNILIDAGTNIKYIEGCLEEHDLNLKKIDYVLITHTHTDHIASLTGLLKKYKPTLVMTEIMFADLPFLENYEKIIIIFDDLNLDGLKIESIKTSHDSSDSKGYIITEEETSVVNITDTGYINQKHFNKIYNKDLYIIESNHDIEKLLHGRYPKWLQKRVLSDVGHLSNESCAYYLSKLIGPKTKQIILAHLSEENNTPELALSTLTNHLAENNISFKNIITAKQFEQTGYIEI